MSHIFISYSRKDLHFAQKIVDALAENKLEVWIDQEDIPKGEKWLAEIYRGIEEANAFLFLISPDAVVSPYCRQEIEHAVENNKRIIPIVVRDADSETIPEVISERNWIFCRDGQDDFEIAIAETRKTIHTDYEWLKYHTSLQVKALEWEKTKDTSRLLRSKELQETENKMARVGNKNDPQPTTLQHSYLLASRRNEERIRRRNIIFMANILIIVISLSLFALRQYKNYLNAAGTAIVEVQAHETAKANEANALAMAETEKAYKDAEVLVDKSLSLRADQFDLSLLLSIEAFNTAEIPRTKGLLVENIQTNPHLLRYLRAHTAPVTSVNYSKGGELLASASSDGTITLWNMEKYQPIGQPLTAGIDPIKSVAFNQNGTTIAAGDAAGNITIWDVKTYQLVGQLLGKHRGSVNSVSFSPDGKILASGGSDGNVILWNLETLRPIGLPYRHYSNAVTSIAFNPSGTLLASGTSGKTIYIWDIQTGQQSGIPLKHTDKVTSVVFNHDGTMLASAGYRSSIILWDIATRNSVWQAPTRPGLVSSLAFSPDGSILAAGDSDKQITLWDLQTLEPLGQPLTGHTGQVNSVTFSPDGKILVSGGSDQAVIVWDFENNRLIGQKMTGHSGWITSVTFSPDGTKIASSSSDESVIIWDTDKRESIGQIFPGYPGWVNSVSFSPDGATLAAGNCEKWDNLNECSQSVITLWDTINQHPIGLPLSADGGQTSSLTFSPDGTLLASASADNTFISLIRGKPVIILWNLKADKPIWQSLSGHDLSVNCLAFSPDGALLASGSSDKTIILWDVESRQPIATLAPDHPGWVYSLAFSPNGRILASGDSDGVVILWDLDSLSPTSQPLTAAEWWITGLAFSPDETTLVASTDNGDILLWDVKTQELIGQLFSGYAYAVYSIAWSPDGETLAAGDNNGAITLWPASPHAWVEALCQRIGRNFTQAEWQQYFLGEEYRTTCPQWPAGE